MSLFNSPNQPVTMTLRVLAHLLSYPDHRLREHLPELGLALRAEQALSASRLAELDGLMDRLGRRRPMEVEAEYVELFDRGRGTALHLFEHVHGDSRDRGPAMVDLIKTYEAAGLYLAPGELPDHLTVLLQYASTQPAAQAVAFLGEIAHIIKVIFSALCKRQSAHACVLGALLDLAGEQAQTVPLPPEPGLDESWEEPLAFDGCASQGQQRPDQVRPNQVQPGQPQPIRFVKKPSTSMPARGTTP